VVAQFVFAQQLSFAGTPAHSPVLASGKLIFGDLSNASQAVAGANHGWAETLPPSGEDALLMERPVQVLRRLADGAASRGVKSPLLIALRDELPPWQDTLLGTVPGGIGETASVALIVGMLYLMMRGVLRWQLPLGVLVAALLMAGICPIRIDDNGAYVWIPAVASVERWPLGLLYVLYHLTSGQLLLAAGLLAGDPTASPLTARGQWLFGLGIGTITIFMRLYGLIECEAYWAILIMNTLVPWIDRCTRPRVLGVRRRGKPTERRAISS
jgi:Na+-translocating ferredoxin:NAD+ oxidoreductase RnfD subunit